MLLHSISSASLWLSYVLNSSLMQKKRVHVHSNVISQIHCNSPATVSNVNNIQDNVQVHLPEAAGNHTKIAMNDSSISRHEIQKVSQIPKTECRTWSFRCMMSNSVFFIASVIGFRFGEWVSSTRGNGVIELQETE